MRDKYQQEIEEILKQAEDVMPEDRPGPKPSGSKPGSLGRMFSPVSRVTGGGFKISAGKLMLASFALLLLALTLGAAGIGNVALFLVAGLVLFVIAYVLFFVGSGGTSPAYEKRWRGRLIEERTSMFDRFKRWLRG